MDSWFVRHRCKTCSGKAHLGSYANLSNAGNCSTYMAVEGNGQNQQRFFRAKKEEVTGGKCLISWKKVCRPRALGGLGLPDLQATSIALRMRWLWQSWQDPGKPWQGLPLPIDDKVKSLFAALVKFHLGDGQRMLFWTDG
jgi:hypothetical protein